MSKLKNLVACCLFAATLPALAVVIRHDVPDLRYRIQETQVKAIANLPHEGHGVLIAPQWILTAAHATQWHPVTEVMLNGKCRKVEKLIVHKGYKPLPKELTTVGADVGPALAALAASDDIALIMLAEPVTDVQPLQLYRGNEEVGKLMQVAGMGATGNGDTGQPPHSAHRTALRRAFNLVDSADARWLGYVFDAGPGAHPLEGMGGNGDSGGPVLVEEQGEWKLAGLTAWTSAEGKIGSGIPGKYGTRSYAVRVSRYLHWIDQEIATNQAPAATGSTGAVRSTGPAQCKCFAERQPGPGGKQE